MKSKKESEVFIVKKKLSGLKLKALIAAVAILSLTITFFSSLSSVKAWAASIFATCTHHVSVDGGTGEVWSDVTGAKLSSGTVIASGSIIGAGTGNGSVIVGLDALSTKSAADDGDLYTLTSAVTFSVSGTTITFTASAATPTAGDGEAAGSSDVLALISEAQRAFWAQHDHARNGNTDGFTWTVTAEATEYSDGQEIFACPDCGYILYTSPISAYDIFNRNYAQKIRKASAGQTITINAGQWVSFRKMLVDEMKKRPDVTFVINFKYKNQKYTLTIPAGTDYSTVEDSDYKGLLYLAGELGILPELR